MKEKLNENDRICSCCGAVMARDEGTVFDSRLLCDCCLMTETRVCSHCGERIWASQNHGTRDQPLCYGCYADHYTRCEDCNALLWRDDAYYDSGNYYCDDCWDRRKSRAINDYYYKPEPVFYGNNGDNRYFGVELEIDDGGEVDENARLIMNVVNRRTEHIYCKHDGSIDDGFELVSHPMTLAYHMKKMPWLDVLNEAQRLGYLSHRAETCGLHIHINRTAFGKTVDEQEAVIARILYFFEKNWEELLRFSRRTRYQLERWAARYGYKDQPREILDHAKKGAYGQRYTCVNLQNANTIEFRIFRGTLKYNTFIATLQLVNRVCEVAIALSDEEMRQLTWSRFVADCTEPELVQYLKERRLYVNEEVVCGEEV